MPSTYYIAWWNLENLFDYENSPRRTDKLRRALGTDIVGWTPELRDHKIDQLVSADRPDERRCRPGSPRDLRGGEPVRGQPPGRTPYQAHPSSPLPGRPRRHPGRSWNRRGLPLRPPLLHCSGGRALPACRNEAHRHQGDLPGQLPHPPGTDVDDPGKPLAIA